MDKQADGPGARCSSVVKRQLLVQWVLGSIPRGGPNELLLLTANAPRLVKQRSWYLLSCLWGGTYKGSLAAI